MSFMYSEEILQEIEATVSRISEKEARAFIKELQNGKRIFCDGLGRSGLCCKGFAMRLMHLGMNSYFVGETVTPSIRPGDILLVCSGSGESKALISHAQKAKQNGAGVALVTGSGSSSLSGLADVQIVIAAPKKEAAGGGSMLPMGTLFEAAAALLFENLVLDLMRQRGETGESMFRRHANLE